MLTLTILVLVAITAKAGMSQRFVLVSLLICSRLTTHSRPLPSTERFADKTSTIREEDYIFCMQKKSLDDLGSTVLASSSTKRSSPLIDLPSEEANAYYPLCESYSGSHFFTFSGTYENIRLPCKYPAIRNTRCGKYSITLTPGNVLDEEGQRFLPDTLWLRVEDTETDLRFEGRTSQKKASRWINLKGSPDPYNQKDGQLKFRDLFYTFTDGTYVGIVEKSATFAIGYYLYNATAQKDFLKSGFSFVCLSPEFTPSDYPEQLCGNQTANEVFLHKKEMGQEDRRVTLIYNVLMDSTVTQIDPNCRTSGRVLRSDACKDKSYEVTHACSPILTKLENRKSITASSSSVISAFMHCTEYLCRDDKDACLSLSDELASVPSLRDEILKGDDCQISV